MNIIFFSSCPLTQQKERLAKPDSVPIFQLRHSGEVASACTAFKSGFLAAPALGDTHDIFFLVSDAVESDLLKITSCYIMHIYSISWLRANLICNLCWHLTLLPVFLGPRGG
jgi:hypothetical protein